MKKIITVILFVLLAGSASVFAGNVETMSTDELKAMLGSSDLIVLDVRRGRDWSSSEYKIKGAVRVEANGVDAAAKKYSKEKTLVFYCA